MDIKESVRKHLNLLKEEKEAWRESSDKLSKEFEFQDFDEAIRFVNQVAKIAEKQNHHPEIEVNYTKVKLTITDHEKGGISEKCHKFVEAVNKLQNKIHESEITEKCWKGYTQKGIKTMFGKRYPNCVKKKKNVNEDENESAKWIKCKNCKKKFTQTIHKGKKSLAVCPHCGTHNTESLLEYKKINYSDEELQTIANKYQHRGDFLKNDRMAYLRAKEKGIFDDITQHMKHKAFKWNRENLQQVISKYNNVPDFRKYDNAAYQAAYFQGILPELIKDLERGGNKFQKIVYVYEFPDNSAYVGLTYNTRIRDWDHKTNPNSQVFKHIEKTKLQPKLKFLTTYIPWEKAKDLEEDFEKKYMKEGWNMLNIATTGGLGANIKFYTDEKIKQDASKSKSLKDFRDNFPGAYRAAYRKGADFWFDTIKDMERDKYSFSNEELEILAAFYNNKKDFETNDRNAYRQALSKGKDFWDMITAHMKKNN